MDKILIRLLSSLARATLDPAFGGRGMALSRLLSLAAFGMVKGDEDALGTVDEIVATMEAALNTPRNLTHEEWNNVQSAAESAHWFLRATFPQVSPSGAIEGGHRPPPPDPIDELPLKPDSPATAPPAPAHA